MQTRKDIARIISWLAGSIIGLFVIIFPLGYFFISYQYMLGSLESEAGISAYIVTQVISKNPEFWEFEHIKLKEHLSLRLRKKYPEIRRIFNSKNELIVESGDELHPPIIRRTYDLMDSGIVVGRIEIARSLQPLLKQTMLLVLLTLPLGTGAFIILRIMPIRAIYRAEEALQKAHDELEIRVKERTAELNNVNKELQNEIMERKRAKEEIHKLNEELELKVEERTKQLLKAQEELVRKEKLATLGQLAGSVGHELRNPLGVMSNAIYFLKTVMPDAEETIKEYLDIIKNEVNNSQRIISDLLDFSRTKTPQLQLIPANKLIRQALGKCGIPENITVHIDIPETLPMIKIDPFQMGQVFQNLITNAVQAMPEGGELRISARLISEFGVNQFRNADCGMRNDEQPNDGVSPKSEIANPQSAIEISVADTGEGISPENMGKLFQPLFTTKAKGIGLGLMVSKRLTEANGGKIEVESQMGNGTTFAVILPVEK